MPSLIFDAQSEDDTRRLGQALAEVLSPGTVVALSGTLGSGKTRLVQAVARSLGVPQESVLSPTFVLLHEYQGTRPIYHFDVYRVRDVDEFEQLGPEEYFDSEGICFIEWAERVEACLPADRIEIHIEITSETDRRFTIRGHGSAAEKTVDALAQRLAADPS